MIFEPKHTQANQREAEVLTKALVRAGQKLGLRCRELATLLRVSGTTIGRFARAERCLKPGSKQWGIALMLVGVYQALRLHMDDDHDQIRLWMCSYNRALNSVPRDAILTVEGLTRTLNYLSGS